MYSLHASPYMLVRNTCFMAADNIHLDMDPWRFYGIPTSACSGPEEETTSGETAYDWEGDFMKEHNVTPFGAARRNPIKRIQVQP